MGQRVTDVIRIDAAPTVILDVITDVEAYPQWIDDVKQVEVRGTDHEGRPLEARFVAAAAGMEASYTLAYSYAPNEVTWELVEGDLLSQLDGEYVLTPSDGAVQVRYTLEGDVSVPLPGFMIKRVAKRILDEGLQGLKRRSEASI